MTSFINQSQVRVSNLETQTIQVSPALPGPPGSGVNIDTAVDAYEQLPKNLTQADQGHTAVSAEDGLLYVWTGSSWPVKGKGAPFRGMQGVQGVGISSITPDDKGTSLVFGKTDKTTSTVLIPQLDTAVSNCTESAVQARDSAFRSQESAEKSEQSNLESFKQFEKAHEQAALTTADRTDTLNARGDVLSIQESVNATHAQSSAIAQKINEDKLSAQESSTVASSSAAEASSIAERVQQLADSVSGAKSVAESSAVNARNSHEATIALQQSVQDSLKAAQELARDGVPHSAYDTYGVVKLPGGSPGVVGGSADMPMVAGWDMKADLDGNGKLREEQLPKISLNEVKVVATRAERLAIRDLENGDMCIQTDSPKQGTYILQGDPSLEDSWIEIIVPNTGVTSVNGNKGDVVLNPDSVGLGNVDNTADVDKPISTAVGNALAGKVDVSGRVTAGVGLIGGGVLGDEVVVSADFGSHAGSVCAGDDPRLSDDRHPLPHAHTIADVSGLETALTGKTSGDFTIRVSTQAPASGVASNVITFRTG